MTSAAEEEPLSGSMNYLDQGFRLELFYNAGNLNRELTCQILKQNLESLNPGKIVITVTGVEWSQYLELRKDEAMPLVFLGWSPDYADPENYVRSFYEQSGTYAGMINYGNETLDAMIEDAASEIDPAVRAAKYKQISMDMYDECVFIWTDQATNFHAERDWLTGYEFNPMHSGLLYYQYDKPETAPAGAPAGYDGDIFLMATIEGNPESLDPAINNENAGGEIIQNVYETLCSYNGSSASELVPVLATEVPTMENGGISPDGLSYRFNLKTDVKFHDNLTMTSEDVRYSIERVLAINDLHSQAWTLGQFLIPDYYQYPTGVWNESLHMFVPGIPIDIIDDAIWSVDSDTIQFNLTDARPAFMNAISGTVASIVPEAWVGANYGFNQDVNKLAIDMCGTGPYEFVSWSWSDRIIMNAFAEYHEGNASIENVVIRQVADANTRTLMLKSGEADSAAIPRAHMDSVRIDGVNITEGIATFNLNFLGLNQNINLVALPNQDYTNVPSTFFDDRNVRRAFAHALDLDLYIEDCLLGMAIQPNGAIPQGMFGYSSDVPIYDHNLTKAADYLRNTASSYVAPPRTADAPTDLKGVVGDQRVALSWNAPSKTGNYPIDYYVVFQDGMDVAHVTANSTVIEGLTNGQTYSFAVAARTMAGMGNWSDPISCLPFATPDAPRDLNGQSLNASVLLRWSEPLNDGGAPVDSYYVHRNGILLAQTYSTSHLDIGVGYAENYSYHVRAHNAAGLGMPSETIQVVVFTPIGLSVECDSSGGTLGVAVTFSGWIFVKGSGEALPNVPISLSYSVTGGSTWIDLMDAVSNNDGRFTVSWLPPASGVYKIRALWEGNDTATPSDNIFNLAISSPGGSPNEVFSVQSNSNVTGLQFNSQTRELSFSVSGVSGTSGYLRVAISKELVREGTNIALSFDEEEMYHTLTESDTSWILYFEYTHSSHEVVIGLEEETDEAGTDGMMLPLVAGAIIAALVSIVAVVIWRKRKG